MEPRPLTRRTTLTSAAALGGLGALGMTPAHATGPEKDPAVAPADEGNGGGRERLRLAFLTDTHADPENTPQQDQLEAVFAAIEGFDPDLVIHGGDVTEHGTAAEYELFDASVPTGLRDRLVSVPGNHETRWDATAGARRLEHLGQSVRHQDVGGVRIILADTTTHQQEVAWWSEESLETLEDALRGARRMPTILVTHFPMGEGYYYVANQQVFEDVVSRHAITLHLTGHTHRELLTRVNRRDQLEGAAVKSAAEYYELIGDAGELAITRVSMPDPSDPAQQERHDVATLALDPLQTRDRLVPRDVDVEPADDALAVRVRVPTAFAGTVDTTHYDASVYAGRNDELEWTSLPEERPRRFTGALDAADLPAGRHRVHVRLTPDDGSGPRLVTQAVDLRGWQAAWEVELDGEVQAAPAVVQGRRDRELLIVGTSAGDLVALDAKGRRRWKRAAPGPIRQDLLALADGERVVAVTGGGAVVCLDGDGHALWQYDHGGPIAADPAAATIDDREVLLVVSGASLLALDAADGSTLWTSELPAPSMGAPSSDGERVFLGAGDGSAHAVDGRDGSELWSTPITDREGSYQRFIYGPWNDSTIVLPDGGVLFSGIEDAWCLDPADGSTRWRLDGSFLYPRKALWEEKLVLCEDAGDIVVADPGTGEELGRHATGERVFDEGFVLHDGVAYVAGHNGLLSAVDLDSGEVERIARISTTPVKAPGVRFGDLIVFADLGGTVHAVAQL